MVAHSAARALSRTRRSQVRPSCRAELDKRAKSRTHKAVAANQKKFELVSQNVIEGDDSPFNGTPAISDNQLFLRSNKFLYCISK
jgi:hypothetical protein